MSAVINMAKSNCVYLDGKYLSSQTATGTWILDSCSSTHYALCHTGKLLSFCHFTAFGEMTFGLAIRFNSVCHIFFYYLLDGWCSSVQPYSFNKGKNCCSSSVDCDGKPMSCNNSTCCPSNSSVGLCPQSGTCCFGKWSLRNCNCWHKSSKHTLGIYFSLNTNIK